MHQDADSGFYLYNARGIGIGCGKNIAKIEIVRKNHIFKTETHNGDKFMSRRIFMQAQARSQFLQPAMRHSQTSKRSQTKNTAFIVHLSYFILFWVQHFMECFSLDA
jgi:hypothetical protein